MDYTTMIFLDDRTMVKALEVTGVGRTNDDNVMAVLIGDNVMNVSSEIGEKLIVELKKLQEADSHE